MKRPIVAGMLALLACGAHAEVPKPPDKGNGNRFQTSARQRKYVDIMTEAWVQCLSPHLGSFMEYELTARLNHTLRNQYSEHAAYAFYYDLVDILREELGMPESAYHSGGRELLAGSAIHDPGVDDLLARAFATSRGALAFRGVWKGKDSLAAQHDRAITRDPHQVEALRELDCRKLDKHQRLGLQDMHRHYADLLLEILPIEGSPRYRKRLNKQLLECFLTTDSARVAPSIRSRLKIGLRDKRSTRTILPPQGYIARDQKLLARLDELLPASLWTRIEVEHRQMIEDPRSYRTVFGQEKEQNTALAGGGDE